MRIVIFLSYFTIVCCMESCEKKNYMKMKTWILAMVFVTGHVSEVTGDYDVSVKLLQYNRDQDDCCDTLEDNEKVCLGDCDVYFEICLHPLPPTQNHTCHGNNQTQRVENKNWFSFATVLRDADFYVWRDIRGQPSFRISVHAYDYDSVESSADLGVTTYVYRGNTTKGLTVKTTPGSKNLNIKLQLTVSCSASYFGRQCDQNETTTTTTTTTTTPTAATPATSPSTSTTKTITKTTTATPTTAHISTTSITTKNSTKTTISTTTIITAKLPTKTNTTILPPLTTTTKTTTFSSTKTNTSTTNTQLTTVIPTIITTPTTRITNQKSPPIYQPTNLTKTPLIYQSTSNTQAINLSNHQTKLSKTPLMNLTTDSSQIALTNSWENSSTTQPRNTSPIPPSTLPTIRSDNSTYLGEKIFNSTDGSSTGKATFSKKWLPIIVGVSTAALLVIVSFVAYLYLTKRRVHRVDTA